MVANRRLRSTAQDEERAAREEQNVRVVVNRLPAELLLVIFQSLADDPESLGFYNWITVTHVCRRWRMAAVSNPMLWTYVGGRGLRFVDTLLTRSKTAPLTFDAEHEWNRRNLSDEELGFPHFHRMRRYRLVGGHAVGRFLRYEHERELHAPILQALELDTFCEVAFVWRTPLPALTDLRLRSMDAANFFSLFTTSLRHLTIDGPSTLKLSVDDILTTLVGLPALQVLNLESCVKTSPGCLQRTSTRTVTLAHLEQLTLSSSVEDYYGTIFHLFQHISCPIHTRLFLWAYMRNDELASGAALAMREHFANRLGTERPVMDQCHLVLTKFDIGIRLSSSVDDPLSLCKYICSESIFQPRQSKYFSNISLSWGDGFTQVCPQRFLPPLSPEELTTVSIHVSRSSYALLLRPIVEAMHNIEQLSVDCPAVANEFLAIQGNPPLNNVELICPRLKSLTIRQRYRSEGARRSGADNGQLDRLTEVIKQRWQISGAATPLDVHFCDTDDL